ncbi:MAG: ATP-binding protein, partial [Deltaproteobacteria bacterium]|nr:ATP-binding protein [Deltaproteobacteria bacterium]
MRGADFKTRARHEGRRYGEDRMVFLRELAQNARDAGATSVRVTCAHENGELAISFADNGRGMGFAHARRYLFTLYSSSKERERASAGRYGVGFWSVLLFEPA